MTDNASFFAGQAAGPTPALPLPGEDLTDAPTAEPTDEPAEIGEEAAVQESEADREDRHA